MSQVPSVPDLLRIGALAPPHVDPVDAVMGADWARLRLGRGGAARTGIDASGARGAKRRRSAIGGVLAPNPQSLVKLIGSGGTSDSRGLKAQMAYLSREGDVSLRSSENTFGVGLGPGDAEGLAAAWGVPDADRGGADRTSHFVVSFPQGTDPGAAERAGRAWAAALFDSGAYGDRWDYYTAFHTDTAYPHIHVVVGRRGLEEGSWLRISGRSEMTFERLREVQVEVAEREGLALAGTSRLARGVHDRPVPDAEFRRARAEGRAAVAPAHTGMTAIIAAATILDHARSYRGAATALREEHPALADRLDLAAGVLLKGQALGIGRDAAPNVSTREAMEMAETVAEVQAEVRRTFIEIEAEIAQVQNPAGRARFLRALAELRADGAAYLRDDTRSQVFTAEAEHRGYRGLAVTSSQEPAGGPIKAAADQEIGRLAREYGLSPEATLIRFAAPKVSIGLGDDFAREERRERAGTYPGETPERRASVLAEFHARVETIYRDAAEQIRALERRDPGAVAPLDETRDAIRGKPEARAPGEAARPPKAPRRPRDRDDDERGR